MKIKQELLKYLMAKRDCKIKWRKQKEKKALKCTYNTRNRCDHEDKTVIVEKFKDKERS